MGASPHAAVMAESPRLRVRSGVVNPTNVSAGLLGVVLYLAGPLPLYLATIEGMEGDRAVLISGLCVAFFTAGVGSILMALWTRQPVALGWALPGLVYLATASQEYPAAELAGAGMVAAAVVTGLAAFGLAERIAAYIPMPVVMAVLAGTAMGYCTGAFVAFETTPAPALAAAAGYLAAKMLRRPWLPPMAGALLAALPLLAATGGAPEAAGPELVPLQAVMPQFHLAALIALVPLLASATLIGNVQGLAILELEGFRTGHRRVHLLTGILSFAHAVVLAPPATMQRAALGLFAGRDAGPHEYRYVAAVVAGVGALLIAVFSTGASDVATALPAGFSEVLVGLVMFTIVLDALRRALSGPAQQGAFLAFVVALSGVSVLGLGSALLALVVGAVVERVERKEVGTG